MQSKDSKTTLWGLVNKAFGGKGRDEIDSITYPVVNTLHKTFDIPSYDGVWSFCHGPSWFDPEECKVAEWKGAEYLNAVEKAAKIVSDAKEQAQKIKNDAKEALVAQIVECMSKSSGIGEVKEFQAQHRAQQDVRQKRALEFISKHKRLLDEYEDVQDDVRRESKRLKHEETDSDR